MSETRWICKNYRFNGRNGVVGGKTPGSDGK